MGCNYLGCLKQNKANPITFYVKFLLINSALFLFVVLFMMGFLIVVVFFSKLCHTTIMSS